LPDLGAVGDLGAVLGAAGLELTREAGGFGPPGLAFGADGLATLVCFKTFATLLTVTFLGGLLSLSTCF
jgi:hypothetical protein